jgi:hypothetical protein
MSDPRDEAILQLLVTLLSTVAIVEKMHERVASLAQEVAATRAEFEKRVRHG